MFLPAGYPGWQNPGQDLRTVSLAGVNGQTSEQCPWQRSPQRSPRGLPEVSLRSPRTARPCQGSVARTPSQYPVKMPVRASLIALVLLALKTWLANGVLATIRGCQKGKRPNGHNKCRDHPWESSSSVTLLSITDTNVHNAVLLPLVPFWAIHRG